MDVLKKLISQFEEEVDGIVDYSKCAVEFKDDAELASMYMEFAKAEQGHAKKLLLQIQKKLDSLKKDEDVAAKLLSTMLDEKLANASARLAAQK